MKCFEKLVMAHINTIIPDTLDPLQFIYCLNRSTDDAISIALHIAFFHLDKRNDCVSTHDANTIITFADDMSVVSLITDADETTFRKDVSDLAVWCQDNNLSLSISKTKGLIMDYRKQRANPAPIHIDRAIGERVDSFKFLDVNITKELTWSTHINTVVKKA